MFSVGLGQSLIMSIPFADFFVVVLFTKADVFKIHNIFK